MLKAILLDLLFTRGEVEKQQGGRSRSRMPRQCAIVPSPKRAFSRSFDVLLVIWMRKIKVVKSTCARFACAHGDAFAIIAWTRILIIIS